MTTAERHPDGDPEQARHQIRTDRDAMAAGLWALRRRGDMVPDAIDVVAEQCTCGTQLVLAALPSSVATAIASRVHGPARRRAVLAALQAPLADWRDRPDHDTREVVELTVWRLCDAVRGVLSETELQVLDETLSDHLTMFAGWD